MDVTIPRTEDLVLWLVWLVIVIILLLRDVWKAYMRRGFWFPRQALVLSAFIFQLLSFVDYLNISVYSGSSYEEKEVSAILVINQLVIGSGRLMMYVLTAYLLPGMARSGSISDASTLAVLALTITFQVIFQVRSHSKVEKRNESLSALAASSEGSDRIISYLCSIILILAIIYLLWLLMRAIMVGRTIRRIMSQKIRSALSCRAPNNVHPTEYHVLKCWIVARLSQPDYVLARSGFCSMVCRIVTACIVLHGIKWRHVQFTDNESRNSVTQRKLVLFVIVGQFVIVLIGWIVLFFRGWISVLHRDISSGDYLNSVSIEDALNDLAASFLAYFCNEQKFLQLLVCLVQKLFQLFPWPWVQKLVQFLTPGFVPIARDNDADFQMYQPILNKLQIGGESEPNLWKANQQGFNRVKRKMEQGRQADVDRLRVLTDLLHRVMEQARQADVARRSVLTGESVERVKELQQANKNSWKRTAVSLIRLMIYFYDGSNAFVIEQDYDIREDMQCYIQAWEYMHFVDGLNVEVKSLGWKTDEEFDRLEDTWNNRRVPGMQQREIEAMLQSEIINPLDKLIALPPEQRDDLQNSRDSAKVADYCLLQTYRHTDVREYRQLPRGQLRRELANVYLFCMTEDLNKAILEKCCKLAEEGREEEILDVAFLSAKAQAVWEAASVERGRPGSFPGGGGPPPPPPGRGGPLLEGGLSPEKPEKLGAQTSTSSHSPTAGVGPGGPTGQKSTSSDIPTAGKGKGQAELQSIELIQSSDAAAGEGKGQPELPPIAPPPPPIAPPPPPMGPRRRPPITSRLPTETATADEENDRKHPVKEKEL